MNLWRDWNEFWFKPISSGPLGLFRLAFGVMVVTYILLLFPDRNLWFTDQGPLTQAASDAYVARQVQGPLLNWLHGIDNPTVLLLFFLAFLASAICLTIGIWTRLAALLVVIGLNCLHNRNHLIDSGADAVMVVMAVYLIFAPSGAACSLSRLRRIMKGDEEVSAAPYLAPWAQRLMQIQVAALYLISVANKWVGDKWIGGTAVYWALMIPDLHRFPTPLLNAHHMWAVNIATYFTLITELALALLIWVPRLRLYVLAMGVLMHVGIDYSMNIPLFSGLMIASYLLFITEADLQHFVAWLQEPLSVTRLRLVYDGHCAFCRSALLVVSYLDVFRLVTLLDAHDPAELRLAPGVREEEIEEAMVAVNPRGRRYAGFEAFRAVAWRLPAAWLLAPFLYLPGIPWLGRQAYRWVADNRYHLPVAPRYAKASSGKRTGCSV